MADDWSSNDDVNASVLPSLLPKHQAIASMVCRQWNTTCAASPFIRGGGFPFGQLAKYVGIPKYAAAWSPDGDAIAFGFNEGSVRMFRTDEGHREIALPDMPRKDNMVVIAIAFSPSSPPDLLVVYVIDSVAIVRLKPAGRPAKEHRLPLRANEIVCHISFAPGSTADRFRVACAVSRGYHIEGHAVYVWDKQANHAWHTVQTWSYRFIMHVSPLEFSIDGQMLAVVTSAAFEADEITIDDEVEVDTLRVYRLSDLSVRMTVNLSCKVDSLAWTSGDTCVTVVDDTGALCVHPLNGDVVRRTGRALCVASRSQKGAPAVLFDDHMNVIDAAGASIKTRPFVKPKSPIMHALLSPNGRAVMLNMRGDDNDASIVVL